MPQQVIFTGRAFTIRIKPYFDDGVGPIEYVATAAGVSMSGDTLEEAVSLLVDRMVSEYTRLAAMPLARLGRIPRRNLAALRKTLETIP
jgi:hypothetical protein